MFHTTYTYSYTNESHCHFWTSNCNMKSKPSTQFGSKKYTSFLHFSNAVLVNYFQLLSDPVPVYFQLLSDPAPVYFQLLSDQISKKTWSRDM